MTDNTDNKLPSFFDDELDDVPVISVVPPAPPVAAPTEPPVVVPEEEELQIEEESEPPQEPPAPEKKKPVAAKSGDLDLAGQYKEDAKEVKQFEQKDKPKKAGSDNAISADQLLHDLTDQAEAACGVEFADDADTQHRFHLLVDSFFKDLRDELETRSKLVMPTISGGMGISEDQAEKVLAILKSKRGEFNQVMSSRIDDAKKKFVAAAAEKQLHDQDRATKKEAEDLERRYHELTDDGSSPEPAVPTKPQPQQPSKVVKVEGKTRAAKSPSVEENELAAALKDLLSAEDEEKKQGEMPKYQAEQTAPTDKKPAEQRSGQPPANLPVAEGGQTPIKEKAEPEPQMESYAKPAKPASPPPVATPKPEAPKKPEPKPAKPPTPKPPAALPAVPQPPTESGKPVMSDVKLTKQRLTGPVEELRSITLKDFRRLSKDPKEATLKLKDKIDLLGDEQSFEVKTQGMKAWRESVVNKLYLEVLRRSLEGMPISQVILDMESKGEEVLSKAEFDAIMKLNREIRFG